MTLVIWAGFLLLVVTIVLLDLGIFHRKAHVVSIPEAFAWTFFWISLALAFNIFIYFLYDQNWLDWTNELAHQLSGRQAAIQFLTGYLIEKSLSIDNIFVIAMIFAFFRVPLEEQHRVLFWGILGAVVLRGIMILVGVGLINRFQWLVYVFGVVLLVSAIKMLVTRHDTIDPDRNLAVRLAKKLYPFSSHYDGSKFFTLHNGKRAGTPLLMALLLVESSDLMFAIDSIPAILAITRDPFLVFTSNVFAILGLRSLYFAMAGLMERFRYLKMSLVFLLAYIGIKMLLSHHYPIPNPVSLAVIGGILFVGVTASLVAGGRDPAALLSPLIDELEDLALLTYRQAKRVVILILGSSLLLIGVVMIFLPGPAILVIPLGLTVLSVEFAWARLWLRRFKKKARQLRQGVDSQVKKWTTRK